MKFLLGLSLACLLATGVFAQHRGGGTGGAHMGYAGGGHMGGRTGYTHNFNNFRNFNFRYGGFRGAFRPYFASYWPWYNSYPGLWDSSYYDSGYSYEPTYNNAPNVTVVYPPPAEPVTPVVITLAAHPVVHEYRQPEDYGLPSEHNSQPALYLIAFNDHVIRAATAYWIENGQLHYLDLDHKPKEAPLSSIDFNFSAQLNRERRVPFNLQQ